MQCHIKGRELVGGLFSGHRTSGLLHACLQLPLMAMAVILYDMSSLLLSPFPPWGQDSASVRSVCVMQKAISTASCCPQWQSLQLIRQLSLSPSL